MEWRRRQLNRGVKGSVITGAGNVIHMRTKKIEIRVFVKQVPKFTENVKRFKRMTLQKLPNNLFLSMV